MALVLGEAVAGTTTLLFVCPLWHEVRRGFFVLAGSVIALVSVAAWFAARAAAAPDEPAGRWASAAAGGLAILALAWFAAMLLRRDGIARIAGLAGVAAGAALLVAFSLTARQAWPLALAQLVAGACFLGAVAAGLLLGHWYLTDRGLTRAPINRYTDVLVVAVVVEAAAVASAGFGPVAESPAFNPLLTAGALAPWIALGMVGTTGLVAVLVRLALRGDRASAVQAATGFFYLAVVTAFTAEVAVKVRFLPR
jgi:hypothetical protein